MYPTGSRWSVGAAQLVGEASGNCLLADGDEVASNGSTSAGFPLQLRRPVDVPGFYSFHANPALQAKPDMTGYWPEAGGGNSLVLPWEDRLMHQTMQVMRPAVADELGRSADFGGPPRVKHSGESGNLPANPKLTSLFTGASALAPGPFGGLILVRGSAGGALNHDEGLAVGLCPCPPELEALNCEVNRLMAYCDVLQAAKTRAVDELAAQHHRDLTAARDKLLSEASQRRSEYADATARLQDENSALRSRVSQLELETSSKSLEAERNTLQRKLGEVELSWSQLLAAKETSWAQDRAMAVESKERLEAQHKQLRSVVLDLEATLRRVVTEKEQVEDALAAETQRSDDSRELARSRSETAAALREVDRLRKEVESLENCAVQREKVFEEKTLELQREVENERQRNNGVVAMYARQVEALEQQLTAAMSKNRVLVTELQKERRQQLQETLK